MKLYGLNNGITLTMLSYQVFLEMNYITLHYLMMIYLDSEHVTIRF